MRMRSTGLGKTELVGQLDEMTRSGDYLILSVRTTAPVKWHVRTAISRKDAIQMLKLALCPNILLYFLSCLTRRDEGAEPATY